MPFDGSGNFQALGLPDFPAIGGQPIYATQFNNVIQDLINGLSTTLGRDGNSSMTGVLQMGGNKITNAAPGTMPGEALVFGQDGTFDDVSIGHNLAVAGQASFQKNVSIINPTAQDTFINLGVTGIGSVLMGFNGGGGLSSISTPAGSPYFGTTQDLPLDFGMGGAHRVRFWPDGGVSMGNKVVERSLAGALEVNNAAAPGTMVLGNKQISGVVHKFGQILFRGYRDVADPAFPAAIWAEGSSAAGIDASIFLAVQQNPTAGVTTPNGYAFRLSSDGQHAFSGTLTGAFAGTFAGTASAAFAAPWAGISGKPTTLAGYGITDGGAGLTSFNGRAGAISLTSADVTNALGFNPISGISSGMVVSALGFTPYSAANPSNFISGISSGMVNTALGYVPYSNANPSGYVNAINNVNQFVGVDAGQGYDLTDATLSVASGTITLTRRKVYRINADTGGGGA